MLSYFPRGVLDEILNLIESVSEVFLPTLVVSKFNLRIQPERRPQRKKVPKPLDVSILKQDRTRQALISDICNRLHALRVSSEDPT